MGSNSLLIHGVLRRSLAVLGLALGMAGTARAAVSVEGHVLDINGRPVEQVQVTLEWGLGASGASAVTVFTDESGRFAFPQAFADASSNELPVVVRALGYEQLRSTSSVNRQGRDETVDLTIIVQSTSNQAAVAPASAWMASIQDPDEQARMVMECVSCHQYPAPEVRDYAAAIEDMHGDSAVAREQSWSMIVRYMNFLWAEEFARGDPERVLDVEASYSTRNNQWAANAIAEHFPGRMDHLEDYDWGAPLIVTPDTVISEYEVPQPNAVREAVMTGSHLWIADVNSDDLIRVHTQTGDQRAFTVPSDVPVGPHTLNRGPDDTVWMAPLFNAVVGQLDPVNEEWRVWRLQDEGSPGPVAIHDLTFDPRHEIIADTRGRIWFSNIATNAVGYFHPETGEVDNFIAPEIPGRPGGSRASLYGIVMTSDRQHIWYSQLGIGAFGSFNTETLEFEVSVHLPSMASGPRRLTISEEDILYVPLFGSGQLIEYDTQAKEQIGIYDLPDRNSAPYAVTWDPVRQVVWIATSNADAIYRFDPGTKEFGVLPLPRQRAYLRMLAVDPATGVLVSSYANVHERVHGPRMGLVIDPGDGYPRSQRISMRPRAED
ncbi:MAG: hypothetical protein F4187_06220 [Gemmatimonadetes bacterium]|nr:hypothetical protein [Gemmatimonadota bacterium]MYJ95068.1 hypothetical protein [Pseudomonadota bacterium]